MGDPLHVLALRTADLLSLVFGSNSYLFFAAGALEDNGHKASMKRQDEAKVVGTLLSLSRRP